MSSYYLRYRQRVHGPFSAQELKDMAARGELTSLHMLSDDRRQWTPVFDVKGLFPDPPPKSADDPDTLSPDHDAFRPESPPPPCALGESVDAAWSLAQPPPTPPPELAGGKNKTTAALLAFFLGGVGVHDFYLGAWGWGLVSIPLVVTGLPILRGVVDAIRLLTLSRERFDRTFNLNPVTPWTSCWD